MTRDEIRQRYRRDLQRNMSIACLLFAFPVALALIGGDLVLAIASYLVAEVHFWLCSIEPTEQWLKENDHEYK